MKKTLMAMVLVVGMFLCFSGANAALIGVGDLLVEPDILSSQPSNYTYVWQGDPFNYGVLTVNATPDYSILGGVKTPIANGSYLLQINLDSAGQIVAGGLGLVIQGNGGTLIQGTVTQFGYEAPGAGYAIFDFLFTPTGGELLAAFGGLGGGTIFVEKGLWGYTGSWDANHGGSTLKTDTAPVPVPTTLLLLGSGLMALLGVKRRIR